MVHRREIEGTEIVVGNQGALWGNAMTWWDHDTGSVWSQPIGEAIMGPRTGETLELLPSTLTTWGDWKTIHPETLALASRTGRSGFDLDDMSIVVEFGDTAAAFTVEDLRRDGVANTTVADIPIAVVVDPDSDSWVVFSRQLDDRVVELRFEGDDLVEVEGAARWHPARGLNRDSDGPNLALLPGFTSFLDDYDTFFPGGLVWSNDELVSIDER